MIQVAHKVAEQKKTKGKRLKWAAGTLIPTPQHVAMPHTKMHQGRNTLKTVEKKGLNVKSKIAQIDVTEATPIDGVPRQTARVVHPKVC